MYKNFEEYWKQKKNILKQLGVDKDAAHMIWCDAADVALYLIEKHIKI